jgi:hypothetical protein
MQTRRPERAVIYLRRSDSRRDMSIRNQLQLAIARAARLGVSLDAQVGDVDRMEREKFTQYKVIVLQRSSTNPA